ncbi:DUF1206 domain-containing protein [Indioceanicola profundi]|uniref:DUF1206 domain-containing protein n=1 Tax=Indioceanicola profundi TaxID=2220096 RepID=UPI000E6AB7FD|nr:DUF1206 domain-containing protein [Indioceanicola profundi]
MVDPLRRVSWLARLGYAARGVVYLIIGYFAIQAARGSGSPTDSEGALSSLLDEPMGRILLAVIALGLLGYSLWRAVQAVLDVDDHGASAKGLAIRGGLLASAVIHTSLAIFAVGLVTGSDGGSGGGGAQDWTAWLLEKPFGQWLVGAVGVAVLGAAVGHFVKAYKAGFRKHMSPDPQVRRIVDPVGRAGLSAKGVVFIILGGFFITAALHADASEVGGLGDVLRTLQSQPFGPWLLGLLALGLIAFGIYSIVEAIYRRIDAPKAVHRLRSAAGG